MRSTSAIAACGARNYFAHHTEVVVIQRIEVSRLDRASVRILAVTEKVVENFKSVAL